MTIPARLLTALLALLVLLGHVPAIRAEEDPAAEPIGHTPPRLSYVHGPVSFWRPGAEDWAPAQLNTPLAPGDELYTGHEGNLELQIGGRAFVRGWGDTQLGLAGQEPDYVQIKLTTGHAAVDLRAVDAGRTVEVATPHAALTIEHPGYYRVDATPERTAFVVRRSGRATVTPAGGHPLAIAPGEEIVLEGAPTASLQRAAAPDLDVWDRWNYARTDEILGAASARHVSSDVYGAHDLDRHGTWRTVPTYGSVWVPAGVAAGWAPYTTGRWIWDPYYGWTWVDAAPWGWAPYHYGRWVHVNSYWAWAPGPLVVRPAYAPALVAFFGTPGIRVSIGVPFVSWVALGWGEPCVPWWGPARFAGRPWWGGWGGPRVVNNVVIDRTMVVHASRINVYRNAGVRHAVVAVREDRFGRGGVRETRVTDVDPRRMEPVRGALRVRPDAASFVARDGRGVRPPESAITRSVVATRPPAARRPDPGGDDRADRRDGRSPRVVPSPARPTPTVRGEQDREDREPVRPGPAREPRRGEPKVPQPRIIDRPLGEARRPEAANPATPRPQPPRVERRPEAAAPQPQRPEPRRELRRREPAPQIQRPEVPRREIRGPDGHPGVERAGARSAVRGSDRRGPAPGERPTDARGQGRADRGPR